MMLMNKFDFFIDFLFDFVNNFWCPKWGGTRSAKQKTIPLRNLHSHMVLFDGGEGRGLGWQFGVYNLLYLKSTMKTLKV